MFKNTSCITALLLLLCLQVIAQESSTVISGVVTDRSSKQAVEFATVQLLNADSTNVNPLSPTKKEDFRLKGLNQPIIFLAALLLVTKSRRSQLL